MRELLRRFFGDFTWTPPQWGASVFGAALQKGGAGFLRLRELVEARIAADPVRFRRQAILIGIVFAAAASLGYWYSRRPRPNYLTVTGTAPAATRLEDILKPDAIRIDFGGSAARLEQIGKPVEKGITMTPRLIGTWNWNTDRQLIFSPMQDWAVGREYVVRFDKKLFPSHVRLEKYEYRFKSASFTGGITGTEFYIDPKNPKLKQVVATIAFSHPIETASLESRIQLQLAGQGGGFLGIGAKSYPYTLSYNKYKNEAYVRSENIEMPAKDTTMDIVVAEGVSAERGGPPTAGKSMAQVKIPGLYSFFHVDSVQPTLVRNERYEPEQVLVAKVTAGMSEVEAQKYLEVYLLPRDLPPIQGRAGQINHHWYDTHIIGPEVLSLSERVKLDPIATDKEYATLHSFKYKAEVGRFLYIRMRKGLESFGGYILAEEFDAIVRVPEFPKELNIMQDGAILSLSGDKKISVISRGIPAVRFELGRVLPGQINHLVSQSGGQFRSPTFNNENFGEENVSERFSLVRTLEQAEPGKTQYTAFDLSEYLTVAGDPDRKRGLFFFRVEGWDPVRKQPLGIDDRRLILVTDLGLLVKSSRDGSRDVFVASIHSGEPLAGVLVQVIGKNGLPVLSVSTDEEGRAHFPPLSDFKNERQPVVYIAHRGSDLSFIPYDWSERQLNLSRFDIGGVVTPQAGAGMDAYLFSDRGIYRPGDEFRIGLIVKAGDWRQSLAGVPLEAVITDARGLEIYKTRISLSGAAFEEIRYRTEETSPTGSYQVGIYIVKDGRRHNLLGSTHVRIEEFLPDRLRITAHLSEEREEGWVSPAKLSGKVTLKNLFGTPAANRRVAGSITLSPAYPGFKSYRDYTFYDPQHAKHSFTDRLPDGMTNADGEAELPLNLERFEKATYRLVFSAEGYESEGGRSVGAESAALVSNLDYLIGYKPDGELRYINKQSSRTIELIAVNAALQKIAVQELTVQLIEERYVSALIQQENGTYKYQSVLKEIPIRTQNLEVSAQGTRYALATGSPGDFALVIRGPDGTEFNRIKFSVVGRANLTRSLEKNAELQIKLNKDDYAPGEEIELEIKAPYVGAGLITIERDKVYAHKWFRSRTTSSIQRIRVPNSIEGNGYVNVSFMRAMDSPEIFMSPLSYGVASFSVSRARRTNVVTLESKDLAKPGEPYVIGYRTQKPGKIVIFAVDEGILQVAGYKTPDPLGYFFEKRALEVNTAQILDLILPEFSLVQALSAPGGDQGAAALGKNLNPFRRKREAPVACWSGIIDANEQAREYSCQIPDYFNGTVRVMAVAVSPDSIGVGEKKAVIRGPFVLTPNAPTFVAPGDEFTVSVGVANNVAGSGKQPELALELKASGHLEILDGASRTLQVGEAREGEALFRLRAKQSLGSANLAFTVRLGENVSRQSVDLSVRPPVPYMTTVAAGHMRADRVEVPVTRQMYPRYRTLEASASPLPLGMARGLIHYLANFPYACTEQLVSRAFPALVLRRRPEFGYSAGKADSSLQEVLRILRARQNAEGAFGFWAANSHVSDFQTVYALHFLTEAKDMGYPIPPDLLARGLGYLSDMLNRSADSLADLRVRAYAVYVLTRNGTVTTGFLNGLRAQLDGKFKKEWRRDLSGVYMAATYKLLKQDMQADGILRDLRLGDPQSADYDNYYDGLVRDAQLLFILAKHFPDRLEDLKGDELLAIVQPVIQGSYNTISSAYTILALSAYADAVGDPKPATLGIHEIDGAGKAKRLVPTGGLFPKTEFAQQAKAVRISNDDSHPLFYQVTQAGFDLAPPSQEIKQKLEIQREYRNLNGKVITEIPMGEEIEVRLKIRATEQRGCHNVAIVDLLPGGFDPVIQRTPPPSLPRPAVRSYSEDGEGESEEEMQESPVPAAADSGNWRPDYVDFREDRVVIFGSVGPSAQEYVYRIKAANQGTFSIPPVFGESMYDRTIQARGLGATMTVTGN